MCQALDIRAGSRSKCPCPPGPDLPKVTWLGSGWELHTAGFRVNLATTILCGALGLLEKVICNWNPKGLLVSG